MGIGHNGAPYYLDPHDPSRMVEVTAIHREIGDTPGCIQPVYVETLCEQHNIPEDRPDTYGKVVDCYIKCLKDYIAGNYIGEYRYFSLYWNRVKDELGIKGTY
jgi:hypothetical protein